MLSVIVMGGLMQYSNQRLKSGIEYDDIPETMFQRGDGMNNASLMNAWEESRHGNPPCFGIGQDGCTGAADVNKGRYAVLSSSLKQHLRLFSVN